MIPATSETRYRAPAPQHHLVDVGFGPLNLNSRGIEASQRFHPAHVARSLAIQTRFDITAVFPVDIHKGASKISFCSSMDAPAVVETQRRTEKAQGSRVVDDARGGDLPRCSL